MKKCHHISRWRAVASKAMDGDYVLKSEAEGFAPSIRWNVAGNCDSPIYREIVTRDAPVDSLAHAIVIERVTSSSHRMTIELQVRCRKCLSCLRARAHMWRIRAVKETETALRTWFVTLTCAPEIHFKTISRARHRLARSGIDFDALTQSERTTEIHREMNPDLTKWVKRMRRNSGATLRIILVMEAHKSGMPHWHALVHETDTPLRHAVITKAWPFGFTNAKLVKDTRAASYVCKYLSKSAISRVRASLRYGLKDSLKLSNRHQDIGEQNAKREQSNDLPSYKKLWQSNNEKFVAPNQCARNSETRTICTKPQGIAGAVLGSPQSHDLPERGEYPLPKLQFGERQGSLYPPENTARPQRGGSATGDQTPHTPSRETAFQEAGGACITSSRRIRTVRSSEENRLAQKATGSIYGVGTQAYGFNRANSARQLD